MTDQPVLWIDPLHDLSVRYAAASWGKDLPETWGILSRAIKAEDLSNPIPAHEFINYVNPPTIQTPSPAPTGGLEELRYNLYKEAIDISLEKEKDTPPPTKKTVTLAAAIGWAFFCFFLLLAYGWVKDMYMPTYIQQPTLLPSPKINPTKTAQPTDSCLLWSQVTAQMEGRTVCVYGTVTSHTEDYTNELTRFYFGTIDQFFLVSNYKWDKPFEDECVTTTGEILLNTYQVPYIKIDDRIDFCSS